VLAKIYRLRLADANTNFRQTKNVIFKQAKVKRMSLRFKTTMIFIAIFLSSCAQNQKIERKNYYSWENEYGYSQVVRAGDTLYISGIASNKSTLDKQIKEIYTYIQRILRDYGVDTSAIVKQVTYTTDIEALKSKTALRKSYFKINEYPSSTIVQIERLYEPNHILEVEVVAIIRK